MFGIKEFSSSADIMKLAYNLRATLALVFGFIQEADTLYYPEN